MKIFISWSGNSSRMVAEALNDWLPRVIQAVKPFLSSDIEKGAKWSNELDDALEGTRFGIICLTPDNLNSDWIHYEAGALSKTKNALLWTFLLNLKQADVKQPLGKFQHTLAEKLDVLKLLKSINAKLGEIGIDPLKEGLLEEIFEESWSKLESKLKNASELIDLPVMVKDDSPVPNLRREGDKLDEILEILRNQQRQEGFEKNANIAISLDETERNYKQINFTLISSLNKYDKTQIEGYITQYFPHSTIKKFTKADKGFYLHVSLGESAHFSYICEVLKILRAKTGYKVENCNFISSDGVKRFVVL
ncbi:MAG TPA: TIR domain-containing protein [Pyrinomonadaceae bacterium]|jgi:hypothetical protein|nr:TIR domain-containing protein [Pyrinomonadaceae bacterium]